MSKIFKLAAASLAGCAAAVAAGQSLLDAEKLFFSPPKDFKIGFQTNHDNRLMTEWLAKDLDDVMHTLAKVTICDTRAADHPCLAFDSLLP